MLQHTRRSFGLTFLWENVVIKLCHQSLVFSGLVLLSRQLGTQKQGQKQGQS
jgi:hypothetical protein